MLKTPFHAFDEDATVHLYVQAGRNMSVLGFLAVGTPDGELYFYDSESKTFGRLKSADAQTWTPYREAPFHLTHGGQTIGLTLSTVYPWYPGDYYLYAAFCDADSRELASNIGGVSITYFQHKMDLIHNAIHVGDAYDSYMADWEQPHPEGIEVSRLFELPVRPSGIAALQCAYFATYYSNNTVFIDRVKLGNLPGSMNAEQWHYAASRISARPLRQGKNIITFKSGRHIVTGHYDNYMVKSVVLFYNETQ
jgi:hypothetical protein